MDKTWDLYGWAVTWVCKQRDTHIKTQMGSTGVVGGHLLSFTVGPPGAGWWWQHDRTVTGWRGLVKICATFQVVLAYLATSIMHQVLCRSTMEKRDKAFCVCLRICVVWEYVCDVTHYKHQVTAHSLPHSTSSYQPFFLPVDTRPYFLLSEKRLENTTFPEPLSQTGGSTFWFFHFLFTAIVVVIWILNSRHWAVTKSSVFVWQQVCARSSPIVLDTREDADLTLLSCWLNFEVDTDYVNL